MELTFLTNYKSLFLVKKEGDISQQRMHLGDCVNTLCKPQCKRALWKRQCNDRFLLDFDVYGFKERGCLGSSKCVSLRCNKTTSIPVLSDFKGHKSYKIRKANQLFYSAR